MTQKDTSEREVVSYEVGFHILSSVAEVAVPAEALRVRAVIEAASGGVFASGEPVLIDLAYPMTKKIGNKNHVFDSAYFGWMRYEAEPSAQEAIKAGLDGIESILRFLIVRVEKDAPVVSVVSHKKHAASAAKETDAVPVNEKIVSEEELDKTIDKLVIE